MPAETSSAGELGRSRWVLSRQVPLTAEHLFSAPGRLRGHRLPNDRLASTAPNLVLGGESGRRRIHYPTNA